ncbi:FAD-dependent oxidoreductase [Phytoactinopolyspora limicola]|uniref:FAD-dependent oxidoreductase n=1 Tax=Phytoactinopolyspora limicola TaxID=2715536 RepID=UPI00140C9F0D|nr:FAD-dependent oxidoreductase [Phytoactinopolyspora limicola]
MTRVVIVGNGMAGSRLVQELRARDPQRHLHITVIGAEPDPAYNRILLSSVLAGSLTAADVEMVSPSWYASEGVDLRLGVAVEHVDRVRQRVLTTAGEHIGYDRLVLATGSRAWVPPIEGLVDELGGGGLGPDVAVFRTLRDCRDILGRLSGVRRAVVLGGGLLGVEAARGLAGRGIEVEIVHPLDRLMERQLDKEASQVLMSTLRPLGVRVRLGAHARAYDEVAGQRVLVLDDGVRVAADVLVVACGVRPDVGLAREAKLAVEQAIVVDDQLASVSDPRIHAIGECAQHAGKVYGLVAPAWEQAVVLAEVITGGKTAYRGSPVVTRLKAADVDLAAMGEVNADADGARGVEVLRFADPARGRYQKIVIRNNRVAGAIMLGGAETVGTVTELFDRSGPVPADPRSLIFPVAGTPATADPARMSDDELVCRCNTVSAGNIRQVCADGAGTVADVALCTRATTGCGGCRDVVSALVDAASCTPSPPRHGAQDARRRAAARVEVPA